MEHQNINVEDIPGFTNLEKEYGIRLKGWYTTKADKEEITLPLGYSDISYSFPVCSYNYRFIMPSIIQFSNGTLTYGLSERVLGVFRFPQDRGGKYCTPVSPSKLEALKGLSKEEVDELLGRKGVLTFDAFKIPQFEFKYFCLDDPDFLSIEKLSDVNFTKNFKDHYESELLTRNRIVIDKIKGLPNTLLILQNVLDLCWTDINKIESMTNNIIHIGCK